MQPRDLRVRGPGRPSVGDQACQDQRGLNVKRWPGPFPAGEGSGNPVRVSAAGWEQKMGIVHRSAADKQELVREKLELRDRRVQAAEGEPYSSPFWVALAF